ncbi:MAG: competence type IV pilus major pilin ComGC [Caryophanon sp.]|nr:competence type IV pilus major pilin ComGC [Caryophanon sp.]
MKRLKGQKGFTLIEMLIVLLIISVLILIMIPNATKYFNTIDDKGCAAYVKMVDSQIEAYRIENPRAEVTVKNLVDNGYLNKADLVNEKLKCPDGRQVIIQENKAYIEGEETNPPKPDNTVNKS